MRKLVQERDAPRVFPAASREWRSLGGSRPRRRGSAGRTVGPGPKHGLQKAAASNPNFAAHVCSLARSGSTPADEALRDLIREHKERDEKLFTSLRAYDIEITQSAGRRRRGGWERTEVALRDMAILCVIVDICYAFGLPPTRSRRSTRERLSGCHIAALALAAEHEAISESAVVKVWTRYGRLVAPEGGWSRYLDERA